MQQTAHSTLCWSFPNFLASGINNWQWDMAILQIWQFADVGINFCNFNIMPTRLAPFLQMLLAWVVNLSCSSTEMLRSFSSGFCTTSVQMYSAFWLSIPYSFILGQSLWSDFREVTFQKGFVIPLGRFVPFFIQNCSTSFIISAACDNFIDGHRRTWIMFS